jgi:hypothetical protein
MTSVLVTSSLIDTTDQDDNDMRHTRSTNTNCPKSRPSCTLRSCSSYKPRLSISVNQWQLTVDSPASVTAATVTSFPF